MHSALYTHDDIVKVLSRSLGETVSLTYIAVLRQAALSEVKSGSFVPFNVSGPGLDISFETHFGKEAPREHSKLLQMSR